MIITVVVTLINLLISSSLLAMPHMAQGAAKLIAPEVFQQHIYPEKTYVILTEVINESTEALMFDQRGDHSFDMPIKPHTHYHCNCMVPQSGFFSISRKHDTWWKRILFVWAKEGKGICDDAQGKNCVLPFGTQQKTRKIRIRATAQSARLEEIKT